MSRKTKIADDLPVLTDMVGEATGSLPILTDEVGEATVRLAIPSDEATESLLAAADEVDAATVSSMPTVEIGETTVRIPILTEVVEEPLVPSPVTVEENVADALLAPTETAATPSATPAAEINTLLPRLQHSVEAHIEKVFAQKLQQHLAAAQQRAVELAIAELKDELPQLIRDALDTPQEPQ